MKYRQTLKEKCGDQRGSAILIAALIMSLMLAFSAFALDLGLEYSYASKLQNALDSAVLAADLELPAENTNCGKWQNAVNAANAYFSLNNPAAAEILTLEPVYKDGIIGNKIIGITATATINVDYKFAPIIGSEQGSLTRTATAELKTVDAMSGLVPLCITESKMNDVQAGEISTLKFGSPGSASNKDGYFITSGWFGIVQLDGTGAAQYRNDFINGSSKVISVGTELNMQTGNLSGPTQESFNTRIAGHTGCTYENHEADCPRIVTIPVVNLLFNGDVKVVSFASFFLENIAGDGEDSIVTATYMESNIVSGTMTYGYAEDYGVYIVKLTN